MAGGGKKEKGEGLGRALIRQRNKAAALAKERGEALAFARRRAMPLEGGGDIDACSSGPRRLTTSPTPRPSPSTPTSSSIYKLEMMDSDLELEATNSGRPEG